MGLINREGEMKQSTLLNRAAWFKISLVVSVVWFAVAYMIISSTRSYRWFSYGKADDGFWLFFFGVVAVLAVFNAVPWIAGSFDQPGDKNPEQVKNSIETKEDFNHNLWVILWITGALVVAVVVAITL